MSRNIKDDNSKKYEITVEMFEHVWKVNEHEDSKAGRILEAMAFLSITAATAFGAFISRQLSVQISLWNYGFNLIPISFVGFAIFVALGIFVFLEASLGGIERQNKKRGDVTKIENKDRKKSFEPQSLFYFKKISEESLDQWSSYFGGNAYDLLKKAYRDHIQETFMISRKTRTKVKYYKLGKICFYLAIIFFVILVGSGCYALR
ncbi:MAG: hypothetical protein ABSA75_07140 [Candidatus Bathyarchaeia archaeon]|jgi:hypothetical protein